jgi:hypothetical protein
MFASLKIRCANFEIGLSSRSLAKAEILCRNRTSLCGFANRRLN